MRCPKCGKRLANGSTICPACGRHIKRNTNIAVAERRHEFDIRKLAPAVPAVIAVALIILTVSVWANVVSMTAETKGAVLDRYTVFTFMEKSGGVLWPFTLMGVLSIIAETIVLAAAVIGFKKPPVWPSVIALVVAVALSAYFFSGIISEQKARESVENASTAASAVSDAPAASETADSSAVSSVAGSSAASSSGIVSYATDTEDVIESHSYRPTPAPYIYIILAVAQLASAAAARAAQKRRREESASSASGKNQSTERLLDDLMSDRKEQSSEKSGKSK